MSFAYEFIRVVFENEMLLDAVKERAAFRLKYADNPLSDDLPEIGGQIYNTFINWFSFEADYYDHANGAASFLEYLIERIISGEVDSEKKNYVEIYLKNKLSKHPSLFIQYKIESDA